MARRAKERGLRLTVNSDAHRADHLSQAGYGISQARRAGLEAEDVLNTWPVDRLSAWLRDRSAEE
jgi:DNA polymerase (family 10)